MAARSGASDRLLQVVEERSYYTFSSISQVLRTPMDDLFTLKMLEKARGQLAQMAERVK